MMTFISIFLIGGWMTVLAMIVYLMFVKIKTNWKYGIFIGVLLGIPAVGVEIFQIYELLYNEFIPLNLYYIGESILLFYLVGMLAIVALQTKTLKKYQYLFGKKTEEEYDEMLQTIIHGFNKPAWLKLAYPCECEEEVVFKMEDINSAYTREHGFTKKDYIGKTDIEAGHLKQDAKIFREHDLKVYFSGEAEEYIEYVKGVAAKYKKMKVRYKGRLGVLGFKV